jgi:hypothetical protein
MKKFNITGTVNAKNHYYISSRFDTNKIVELIDDMKCFVIHAPHRSGKTTAILEFVKELNAEGTYKAVYVNISLVLKARGDVAKGLSYILQSFKEALLKEKIRDTASIEYIEKLLTEDGSEFISLKTFLQHWAMNSKKPIALFIDEMDLLKGDVLISVLRQLRTGHSNRPKAFPQALCLISMRDVKDRDSDHPKEYEMSPATRGFFNIKSDVIRLEDFSKRDVQSLYGQHTLETGQAFADEAIEYAFEQTQGQPWLVNALAYECCFEMVKDGSKIITKNVMKQARKNLFLQENAHFYYLIEQIQKPFVKEILECFVLKKRQCLHIATDDLFFVQDTGLLTKRERDIVVSNPIYRDIILSELEYEGTEQKFLEENLSAGEGG